MPTLPPSPPPSLTNQCYVTYLDKCELENSKLKYLHGHGQLNTISFCLVKVISVVGGLFVYIFKNNNKEIKINIFSPFARIFL